MKKILSLVCLLMLAMTSAWAGEVATFDLGKSPGTSTPAGFFTHEAASAAGKWNWNSKFKDAEYDGIKFSQGLKMEGATAIDFTTTAVSTVTIVQSTWSANTITFDGTALDVASAADGTGCRIYTLTDVKAGAHVIARGSGESGLFYIKVEWEATKTVTFINDANWETVYVYAWSGEGENTQLYTSEWPGDPLTPNADGTYTWTTTGDPTGIVFSNGTAQTPDLEFKDGGKYDSSKRIIEMNNFSVSFKTDGMDEVYAYVWSGEGENKVLGDWPGTKMKGGNGDFSIAFEAEEAPKFIIFHNNAGDQTPDWEFEDGKAYEYNLNEYTATFTYFSSTIWGNVYAYAWSGEGDDVKEFAGAWPGTQLTLSGDAYAFSCKAFNAPEKIIFNSGSNENQTADLPFINGKAYKWNTTIPFYALKEGDTFAAGTTVDLTAATITYGVDGGADFGAAYAAVNEDYAGFAFMTGGNGENGSIDGGTVYTIVPQYEGTITIGVRLNGNKAMHINEDGTDLEGYSGYKIANASNTTFSFAVKAGSTYKIWCDGSKLGFFGFDYSYAAPVAGTATFDFTDPNFRENIGETMTDTKGYIYNETFIANETTLQVTAGSAPSRIYKDANRGQCLVTYKEYTTLTFEAPEGKAISQIEFTAAGNSNINNFTPSSGSIDGMIWTGHATGVRFQQGGTSYLANAIVTLEDATPNSQPLPEIEYIECANIAAFNALEPGTYAKLTLTDAEVIGKSADGYSTVWIQDATGGAWVQYTSLNESLTEMTKLNGFIYTVKRAASGNPQLKEAEYTPLSSVESEEISEYTIIDGNTISEVNVPGNLNRLVRVSGATFEATSNTSGTLTLGEETITMNNGGETANQQLHKLEFAKGDKFENVIVVAILAATSATDASKNQFYPISMEIAGETEAGEELSVERYPGMGYGTTTATVDLTAAKEFLGVEELTESMLAIINPDGTEVSNYADYDGWFNTEGAAETWQSLNQEGKPGINIKFFQAIPNGEYSICDMNGADVIGNIYTVKWALKANGKTYTYTINVEFVEVPVVELAKSDLEVIASVEYPANCGNYEEQVVTLSDEQVQSILTELGLESLAAATVYGYNPTTGELLASYSGYDGWRDANGDFAMHTGDSTVPACVKYTDGQNYLCYSIAGCEPQTIKTYWAIANATKYVLVEIDFIYTEPEAIELTLTDVEIEVNVNYDVSWGDYAEKTYLLSDEEATSILGAIGLESFDDEGFKAYIYDPATGEFAADNFNGWRSADGLGHAWTGTEEAPACAQFRKEENTPWQFFFYNLYGIEPQTITTYYAFANNANGMAALVKVNFTYEGTFPTYTVAGAFGTKNADDADEIFGNAWDITAEANNMTKDGRTTWTLTIEDVELTAGTIYYKVVQDNSWDNSWGFDGNNADYVVNLPEGLDKAFFDITFTFCPIYLLNNNYNVTCDVVFDEATTVGINSMAANKQTNEAIYNLQGVRLVKLQKGLNIVGGKKIVVK